MRTRLAPVVLAVLAVASAVVAVVPQLQKTDPAPLTVKLATPAFSVRRAPGLVARTVAGTRLQADLQEVVEDPDFGAARNATCLAVQDPDGRSLFARQTQVPLIPASTFKVVTGAAALGKLGPDTRYTTNVRAVAPAQDGGVGDLWLVGSGDPLLATADYASTAGWLETPRPATSIEELADRIVNAGVRQVGRLIGDESRYDTQRYIPSWRETYASGPEVGPQSALTVNSGFAQWRPREVPAASPATSGANVLATLLRERGVSVGGVGEGTAAARTVVVASVDSLPMSDVVGAMLIHSDNLSAELLVKELGARFGGAGTTAAGLEVLRSQAVSMGLSGDAFAAVDGSGLDRSDRVTCELLQAALASSGPDGPVARGLPTAGKSGTLLRRFNSTPAAGKVRAKTGSLEGVVGLSGWADGTDRRSLQFSLVANDLASESLGVALQDRVVSVLATYPKAPAPDEIAPQPPEPLPQPAPAQLQPAPVPG